MSDDINESDETNSGDVLRELADRIDDGDFAHAELERRDIIDEKSFRAWENIRYCRAEMYVLTLSTDHAVDAESVINHVTGMVQNE